MRKIIKLIGLFLIICVCSKVKAYEQYNIGDKVNYKNEYYYVIEDSDSDTSYITLLKERSLTIDDINKYGRNENGELFVNKYVINKNDPEKVIYEYEDGSGGIAYYNSELCRAEYEWTVSSSHSLNKITDKCLIDYDSSDIKKVIDNWASDNFDANDLVESGGYNARILNRNDLYNRPVREVFVENI